MSFTIGNYCGYAKIYCIYCSEFYLGHCELGGHCVYKKMPYETENVHQGGKGMSNEEALKEIEKQIADAGYVYDDFLGICKESLEKQIPKKINSDDGFGGRCPVCGCYNIKSTFSIKGHKYCSECGQKLDWEVKE